MFNRRIETDFQMRALPSSVRSTEPGISFRIISVEQVLFVRIRVIAIGCIEIRWEFGNVLKWVCLVNSTTDKIEMAKNELKPSDSESYLKCYHNSYGWFRMPSQMARVTSLGGFTCITNWTDCSRRQPCTRLYTSHPESHRDWAKDCTQVCCSLDQQVCNRI